MEETVLTSVLVYVHFKQISIVGYRQQFSIFHIHSNILSESRKMKIIRSLLEEMVSPHLYIDLCSEKLPKNCF